MEDPSAATCVGGPCWIARPQCSSGAVRAGIHCAPQVGPFLRRPMFPTMNLTDLILSRCAAQPESVAVYDGATPLTFGELEVKVGLLRQELRETTIRGDIVSLVGLTIPLVCGYLAAMAENRVAELSAVGRISAAARYSSPFHRTNHPRRIDEMGHGGVILQTSGTSGAPKKVLHSVVGLASGVINTLSVEAELTHAPIPSDPEDLSLLRDRKPHGIRLISGMPVTTISGLSMLNRTLAMGESTVFADRAKTQELWDLLCSPDTSSAGLTPSTAQRLLRTVETASPVHPSLLSIGIGGARVEAGLARDLESRFGCPVTAGYGSTELGGVAVMSRPWDPAEQRWSTVGRPLQFVEVRLVPAAGGLQELHVRSAASMVGTLSSDDMLTPADHWVSTGDAASRDHLGNLQIVGRLDYVIQRGGRRIDPARIENVLCGHPAVTAAGVVALPSRVPGEEDIYALVELNAEVGPRELHDTCRAELEPTEIPRRVYRVPTVPLTEDGSPRRAELPDLLSAARQEQQ